MSNVINNVLNSIELVNQLFLRAIFCLSSDCSLETCLVCSTGEEVEKDYEKHSRSRLQSEKLALVLTVPDDSDSTIAATSRFFQSFLGLSSVLWLIIFDMLLAVAFTLFTLDTTFRFF